MSCITQTPSPHSPSLFQIGPFDQHLGSLDYKPGSVLRLQARKSLVPGAPITPQLGKHCGVAGGQHGAPCRPLQLSSQLSSPPPSPWPPARHSVPGCPLVLPVWNELSPSPHLATSSASVSTAARPPQEFFPNHLIISCGHPADTPTVSVASPLPSCMHGHRLAVPCLFICVLHIVCFPQIRCHLHGGGDGEPCLHRCVLSVYNSLGTNHMCQGRDFRRLPGDQVCR